MKEQRSNNRYSSNWLDRHHMGFVNLVLYALLPHTAEERDELVQNRHLKAYEMNALWPRPWLYLRAMLLFAVGLLLLYFCWKYEGREESSTLLPGLAVVGSLAMPVTLLIFFWEVNKWRSLTLLDVLRYFLIGSILAIAITFALLFILDLTPDERWYYNGHNYFTPRLVLDYDIVPFIVTACIEEFAKGIIIFAILYRHSRECHILHGILVGAAVGAGFAVFESAGYIVMDTDHLLNAVLVRSFTAPACHVAWGALMGGAIAMVAKGRMRLTLLLHPKVIAAFLLICALHFAWNYLQSSGTPINWSIDLSIVTWFLLLLAIRCGVHEIDEEQRMES